MFAYAVTCPPVYFPFACFRIRLTHKTYELQIETLRFMNGFNLKILRTNRNPSHQTRLVTPAGGAGETLLGLVWDWRGFCVGGLCVCGAAGGGGHGMIRDQNHVWLKVVPVPTLLSEVAAKPRNARRQRNTQAITSTTNAVYRVMSSI